MTDDKVMIAPDDKGFTVFRGDTFWDSEREVHITIDKSILKSIETVEKSDCEKIMEELSR